LITLITYWIAKKKNPPLRKPVPTAQGLKRNHPRIVAAVGLRNHPGCFKRAHTIHQRSTLGNYIRLRIMGF
jgi:hypothetical protein